MSVVNNTKQIMDSFGGYLEAYRKQKNISAYALAQKSGITDSAIRFYEKGETYPSLNNFIKIAYGLNLKPSDFLQLLEEGIHK